jgi:hypothetical protein
VLVVNINQGALFLALTSVCIVMLYLAYLFVTVPLLFQRLRGWPRGTATFTTDRGGSLFALGRWGVPINIVAVAYGVAMAVNLAWPRAEVYNPTGGAWYLQWFAPLFVGGSLAIGALAYARYHGRLRSAVVAAAQSPLSSTEMAASAEMVLSTEPGVEPA